MPGGAERRSTRVLLSVIAVCPPRASTLSRFCKALAGQSLPRDRFEAVIALRSPDADCAEIASHAAGSLGVPVRVLPGRGECDSVLRNRACGDALGSVIAYFEIDDAPRPECLAAHADAHRSTRADQTAIVFGPRMPEPRSSPTLFDRMLEGRCAASQSAGADPVARDPGTGRAMLSNVSLLASAHRQVGGLSVMGDGAPYADEEFLWRARRAGIPLRDCPGAASEQTSHDSPEAWLERGLRLGAAALPFARSSRSAALALLGRDVCSPDELDYSRRFVEHETAFAQRQAQSFRALANAPAAMADGPGGPAMLDALHELSLPLRRFVWRAGLAAALEGEPRESLSLSMIGLAAAARSPGRPPAVRPAALSLVGAV